LQHLDIENRLTILDYMIQGLQTVDCISTIVLGISDGAENTAFQDVAARHGIEAVRGDETDVLMRLIQCGETGGGTDVYRVTTESPFTYLEAVPDAWQLHVESDNDTTTMDGLPEGSAFEIHKLSALQVSHQRGDRRHRSELCSLYIREHLDEFRVQVLEPPLELRRLDVRLTVDYPEDLVLCRRVFEQFSDFSPRIPLGRVIEFLDDHAELTDLVGPYVVAERLYPEDTPAGETGELNVLSAGDFSASDDYRNESHKYIPGGAHTYSKGDDQFPSLSPAAIARGLGGRVWDIDGNEYVDCSMALGSVSLGHAHDPVLKAVHEQLGKGVNFQRPADIELEFAREFVQSIPGAERVKFAKNGSTVTSAAVKLARAYTKRDLVAFPGNHAFYSYDDWFIGSTVCSNGVPSAVRDLSVTYDSNKPETLEALFHQYPDRIACVISEPEEVLPSSPDSFRNVVQIARKNGAVFVADEMVTGYRAGWPGACANLGIEPDLSTWGKALGNGFSFCALTGRADILDLGGILQTHAPRVFLMSTTHGGEAHAVAAALAVLREYRSKDILGRHRRLVNSVLEGMTSAVASNSLTANVELHASPWRIVTVCRDAQGQVSQPLRTLLLQEMIKRGVLFQGLFLPCYSHSDADVAQIVHAFDESCQVIRNAIGCRVDEFLVGEVTRPVFRKYNGCTQACPSTPCPLEHLCKRT
jgi:glutamate-1-semialdehyde aminotransferase/spore coat polysaccharide biosynthesis protein SpsF (cytidylyltransferase family)